MDDEATGCCDLVMKGGVTSGIVYPSAIQEIAKKFHFVGIGGTSAGAIAAAVTAAAEYRRRHTHSVEGFKMLEQVSADMSREGRLLSLFQPDNSTKHYFDLASPFLLGPTSKWTKVWLGIKLGWKLITKRRRNKFFEPLVANKFGVCTGMANQNKGSESALTEWLSGLIDDVSDTKTDHHLTFADLHGAPPPTGCEDFFDDKSPTIDFRAVTTSLTFGRPFEFPLQTHELAFDVKEWEEYFPDSVMRQLKDSAESIKSEEAKLLKRDGKLPLPTLDLPIIVAARMSLSFPVLFSAVPLYAKNYNKEGDPLERVMFSDGGITSNFPVHRFDSIYPRWPTLAINFKGTDDDGKPLRKALRANNKLTYTYMNKDREEGVVDLWATIFKKDEALASFFAFAFSIFRSAQNWHDNAFLRLPCFRDRVVEVWLRQGEGGLNLKMKEETVKRLTGLGQEAGEKLAIRYSTLDDSDEMSWSGHKWTRFRSGIEGLTESMGKFSRSIGANGFDASDLAELFASIDAPSCFQFDDDEKRVEARRLTVKIFELAQELEELKAFDDGPRPPTEFGSRAPI